jgi:hypothetical protein
MSDTLHSRVPRLGLRHRDRSRPLLAFTLTGAVPDHPLTVDHLSQVPVWNGETNYYYGTCGPVYVYNSAIATWRYLLGQEISGTDDQVFDLYRRSGNPDFDPATGQGDNGVDMTVMLAELVRNGIDVTHADGSTERIKPYCFGSVPVGTYEDLHACTSIFGHLGMASDLDQAQQAQTDAGLWDYVKGSPAWGGHATLGGAYTSKLGPGLADISLITWLMRCGTTQAFITHQLAEAYAVVWPPLWDHPAFQAGVDQAALADDYTAITGRAWPGPAPAPGPGPGPAPPPAEMTFTQAWAAGSADGIQHWTRQGRTRPDLVRLKGELLAVARHNGLPL